MQQITVPKTKVKENIRKFVYQIRKKASLDKQLYFPIVEYMENALGTIDNDFTLDVCPDNELPGILAEACPELHTIKVRQTVYDGACLGHYWHRMTLAHELGHYFYHSSSNVYFAKVAPGERIPISRDPETQADIFAAELLMPLQLIRNMNYRDIAMKCGVSYRSAKIRIRDINYLKKRKEQKRSKYSVKSKQGNQAYKNEKR